MKIEKCQKVNTTRSQKQQKNLEFQHKHLDVGKQKELSQPSEHPVVNALLTCHLCVHKPLYNNTINSRERLLCTQGCHHQNKEMTSNVKKHFYENIVLSSQPDQKMLLRSRTLARVSTSKGPDFYEFWDSSRAEVYQRLSWLHETGWPGSVTNLSNGCATSTGQKSWFSTIKIPRQKKSLGRTSCTSFKFTVADGMAEGDTHQQTVKTYKLKLRPTPQQKKTMNEWAGSYRFTYNKAISLLVKKNNTHRTPISIQNRLVIKQKRETKSINTFLASREWLERCPCAIRKKAVREAHSNLKSCFTNLRRRKISHFTAPYKTKKSETKDGWSVSMEKTNVVVKDSSHLYIYGRFLGEMRYYSVKQLRKLIPEKSPQQDCKLQRDGYGDYYLIITLTQSCQRKPDIITKVTSVDPGVRKFVSTYDNDTVAFYGNRWGTKITELTLHIDNLCSRKSRALGKKKWVLQQRITRIRKQIHNFKREMMYQVANSIVKSSDLVLMPKLSTKDLVIKCKRRLTTKTVKQLLSACHGKFFDHLRYKCNDRGKHFLQVSEHYTSQTCPYCGELNKCNEVYKCKSCNFIHDRDAVGSLNILLRAVRDNNSSLEETGS